MKRINQFSYGRRESDFKRLFFLKNRHIHSHINSTSVIKPVKQNQLSLSSIEILDQIKVQKPILDVATDQMPDYT